LGPAVDKLFAVCAPGLGPVLAQELAQLGLTTRRAIVPWESSGHGPDGVEFEGELHDLYRANLWLRTASRVLVRLGEFNASAFPELRRKASHLPWERYLGPGQPVALRVTCDKSRLYHSGGVAERVAGAMADRLGSVTGAKIRRDAETNLPD
jgi:putative N6-adenine-specific DNA methylase